MKKSRIFIFLILISFAACKKNYDALPTYAGTPIAGAWAKQETYYHPVATRYDEVAGKWQPFIAFTFTSDAEPDKIGFANPYVLGKGTNALDFNRIYSLQGLTSDPGFYNITIPKCFQFIPKSKDSVNTGKVIVIPQTVRGYRKDHTYFDIIIGPSTEPGTYSILSGLFEIEVQFDETSIGGSNNVKRKYRFVS